MCAALSISPPEANPNTMLMMIEHDQLADDAARLPVDRVMETSRRDQDTDHPEHGARRADRRHVAAEHETGRRARRGRRQVEQQEAERAVPALDDRAHQEERVHVERQVEQVDVEQRHRPQSPVLPGGHAGLVELQVP